MGSDHHATQAAVTREIALLTLSRSGTARAGWHHGPQQVVTPDTAEIATAMAAVTAPALLCLDESLPFPEPEVLDRLLAGPADVWHGGLRLGMAGQSEMFDLVHPLWMLNAPADPDIETTSWQVSLRAVLLRTTVPAQLDGPDPAFETLAGAGLEVGLRWTRSGALVRHSPDLVPPGTTAIDPPATAADGLRLVGRHHGRTWAAWALQRSVVLRRRGRGAVSLARAVARMAPRPVTPYEAPVRAPGTTDRTVSVIVPTIDRYPYLEQLLHQLAAQTVAPHEVVVVDQTAAARRRSDLTGIEPELPVTVIPQEIPGQSTARNTAIERSTGELLLFIDDDDEIGPDLLTGHLARLGVGVDAVSGGVDDATAGPPPAGFRHRRASTSFPTNNTMLRRSALGRSGLFDPTFDRLPREDHDLGMRLHLSGAVLVYDPSVMVFHHHAPAGGLRTHGTRRITRASARRSVTERNLPAPTDTYLGLRYYPASAVHEAQVLRVLSVVSGGGSPARRIARGVVQLCLLPNTLARVRATERAGRQLFAQRHPVPELSAGLPDAGDR